MRACARACCSLWFLIGSAEGDESRGIYNSGYGRGHSSQDHQAFGLHIRGPQLNPQVRNNDCCNMYHCCCCCCCC